LKQAGAFAPNHKLRSAVTAVAISNGGKRRDAATMFRWMLPTCPAMAMEGTIGPPGRSPRGLFRLVHNCE